MQNTGHQMDPRKDACSQLNTALSDLQCMLKTHTVLQMNLQKNWFRVSDEFKQVAKFKYRMCNDEDPAPFLLDLFQSPVPNF